MIEKEILGLIISMGNFMDKSNPDLETRKQIFEWMSVLVEIAERLPKGRIMRMSGKSETIKNYLKSWEHGTDESLLFEVAEKLYELQIDFDEIRDNHLQIVDDKIRFLEQKLKSQEKGE